MKVRKQFPWRMFDRKIALMAMGSRREQQEELWIPTSTLARSASHPFYQRLDQLLTEHDFDRFVEGLCRRFYAAIMGGGAALIMPSTLSIIINVFPPAERPKAIAIWASVTGAAGAFGPVASGLLLAHFWWGSVFLINVPVILVALVAGWFFVPKSRDPQHAPLAIAVTWRALRRRRPRRLHAA